MVQAKVDKATGKVTFPKPEAKEAAAPEDVLYIALPRAIADKIATLAKKDGFKPDAETEKGQQIQTSRVIKTYVLLAIDMLLDKRATG